VWVIVEVPTPPKVTVSLAVPFNTKETTLFATDPVMLRTLVFVFKQPAEAVGLVQVLDHVCVLEV